MSKKIEYCTCNEDSCPYHADAADMSTARLIERIARDTLELKIRLTHSEDDGDESGTINGPSASDVASMKDSGRAR